MNFVTVFKEKYSCIKGTVLLYFFLIQLYEGRRTVTKFIKYSNKFWLIQPYKSKNTAIKNFFLFIADDEIPGLISEMNEIYSYLIQKCIENDSAFKIVVIGVK